MYNLCLNSIIKIKDNLKIGKNLNINFFKEDTKWARNT